MYLYYYYINFIYLYLFEHGVINTSFIMAYLLNIYKRIFPYYRYFSFYYYYYY